MNSDLRPLSIGELLDRSFALYRRNFVVFLGIAAIPALFYLASRLAFIALLTKGQPVLATNPGISMWAQFSGRYAALSITSSVVNFVVLVASWAAMVYAASAVYLRQPVSIAQAFTGIKGDLGRYLAVAFVTALLTLVGFALLVIPGILLLLRWALVMPATVLEQAGVSESRQRSTFLTEDSRGRIFLIFVLWAVVVYVLTFVLEIPIIGGLMASAIRARGSAPVLPFWYFAASFAVSFVVNSLTAPIIGIALTLQYYDGRIRKEALDLQMLMQSASGATAGA